MRIIFLAALSATVSTPAAAELVSSSANGFHVRHQATVSVPPDKAFAAFAAIADWWGKDHTYSGNSANLSLEPRVGGCFCERLDGGGGVEHLRVAYVDPGKRIVLTGSLGPLLYDATSGSMDVRFEKSATGTIVKLDYRVAGFAAGGADTIAPAVDEVLGVQARNLAAAAGAGR